MLLLGSVLVVVGCTRPLLLLDLPGPPPGGTDVQVALLRESLEVSVVDLARGSQADEIQVHDTYLAPRKISWPACLALAAAVAAVLLAAACQPRATWATCAVLAASIVWLYSYAGSGHAWTRSSGEPAVSWTDYPPLAAVSGGDPLVNAWSTWAALAASPLLLAASVKPLESARRGP